LIRAKQYFIFGIVAMMMVSSVSSDVFISGNSRLDNTTKQFTQTQLFDFGDNEFAGTLGVGQYKPLKVQLVRSCENISLFNSNNPDYSVEYVNWSVQHLSNTYSVFGRSTNQTTISYSFGCSINACDYSNTPYNAGIGTVQYTFFQTLLHFFSITPAISGSAEFNLVHRDALSVTMLTQFNGTKIAYDSPCTYELKTQSFGCKGCDKFTFEELTNTVESEQETQQLNINATSKVHSFVRLNYQAWAIFLWVFRILVFIAVIGIIIWLIFYTYHQINGGR